MASSQTAGETEGAVSEGGGREEKEPVEDSTESGALEVVSVTDEDLPTVETPTTFNISSFSSQNSGRSVPFYDPHSQDPHVPVELPSEASAQLPVYKTHHIQIPPSPGVPVIKVQPFFYGEDLSDFKSLCWPYVSRRLLVLLISLGLLIALSLALGIGLGVGLESCSGKFRCVSSVRCISRAAVCDGVQDCGEGEDELNCVRVSGRSSVLQVYSRGLWRTVCFEGWNSNLSLSACRQLGYNSYVNSSAVAISSIEITFQNNLVALNINQPLLESFKIQNSSFLRKSQCSSGLVTVLSCIECGFRAAVRTRIAGGNISSPVQVPWQVSLNYQNQHLCGGSIISDRWILTAAHCVYGFAQPVLWAVHAGIIDLPVSGSGALAVEKIIYHTDYRPEGLSYDIALIKLKLPLSFNDQMAPICLPNHGETFDDGHMCLISGWGATQSGGEASVSLHTAQVPLLSSRECRRPGLSSWNVCAGYVEGGAGMCQGDSGGPLACQGSVWTLVGAASWAQSCGQENRPGVYTSISHSLTWIHQQMEKEEDQSRRASHGG